MPRWADHDEYMPAVWRLLGERRMYGDGRVTLDEVMEVAGVGQRLARTLLRKAEVELRRGRPWPGHLEYMPTLRELIEHQQHHGGGRISRELVMEKLGIGRELAEVLLAEAGVPGGRLSDEDLRPILEELIGTEGSGLSLIGVERRVGVDHRRVKQVLADLVELPEELTNGRRIGLQIGDGEDRPALRARA